MRQATKSITVAAALLLVASTARAQGAKPLAKCPADAVVSGTVCMDRYEASVWRVPDPTGANGALVKRIRQGKATVEHLTAAGAMQLGTSGDDYAPCLDGGQGCDDDVFAVSLPGVTPSASLTWFQALAACRNARKRLPSNAEWQAAVAGTPKPVADDDATTCKIAGAPAAVDTGARVECVSSRGAFDMVGNVAEWVAEWRPRSTICGSWSPSLGTIGDSQCLAGAATTGGPGALLRGGSYTSGTAAGPFAVSALAETSFVSAAVGFRCAR